MDYMRRFPVFPRSQDLMTAFHRGEYAKAMAEPCGGYRVRPGEKPPVSRSLLAEQQ